MNTKNNKSQTQVLKLNPSLM